MIDIAEVASGLQEVEPGLWKAEDELADISYPESGHQECATVEATSFWFHHRNQCIVTAMERYPPPGPVFDIGGGNGLVTQALRQAGHESIVIEPGPNGARTALDRGLAPVIQSTVEAAQFTAGALPATSLFDVLEHIEDDVGFLQELRALMIRRGRLYLTVPAHRWLWSTEDERALHFRRYSFRTLRRVVEAAGFEVEMSTYFFRVLPVPIFVARTIPTLLRRRTTDTARQASEHSAEGIAGRLLEASLKRELTLLRSREMRFGASILLVAIKPQ